MARVPNFVPRERGFRPLIRAVGRVTLTGKSCPTCGSSEIRRSMRQWALDFVLAFLFLVPFRCRVCRARFYRFWRPVPVLIMPRHILEMEMSEPDVAASELIEPAHSERAPLRLVDPRPRAAEPVRPASPRSILILESDLSIRKLLRRLLERRGYFIHEVMQSGDLAAELRERRVDLLIVDVLLMGAGGLEAAFGLAGPHPNLKILALSTESLNGAKVAERCSTLRKPFSLESFLACVERLLEPQAPPDNE
jgi:CheY-like chemotaxis protein